MRGTLGERFETQPNALNLLRLLLAATVVVHHSADFTDTTVPGPVYQLLSQLPVDAFFAVSGFLICRSWTRSPHLGSFAMARATRLLPGLAGAVIVTAFLIAPLLVDPSLGGQLAYVLGNVTTLGVSDMNSSLDPDGNWWNGPLWTLGPEALCYATVAVLGLRRLLHARVVVLAVVCFWAMGLGVAMIGVTDTLDPLHALARLGLMFACGALLWLLRDRVPVNGRLAAAAAVLLAVGACTPNYRLLAGPALAYLCLWVALRLGRHRRLVLGHDLSYGVYIYGWPVQHLLVTVGLAGSWATFSLVSLAVTLPLAAVSWFAVERPAMRLRRRFTSRNPARPAVSPAATVAAGARA